MNEEENEVQQFARGLFEYYNSWQKENRELTTKEILVVIDRWKEYESIHTEHNPQEKPNCKYEKAYYILMEYWDLLPEGEDKEDLHKRLEAVGL